MNNFKVSTKLLILSALLMSFLVGLGVMAINQLSAQNERMKVIGSREFVNAQKIADAQSTFLASVGSQKNAVLAPTVKDSEKYASESRESLDKYLSIVSELANSFDSNSMTRLSEASRKFDALNDECLDLAVQNTNLKGTELINTELKQQLELLVEYAEKVANASKPATADAPDNASPAGNDNWSLRLAKTLFEIQSLSVLHLNTSSSSPEFAAIDAKLSASLAELRSLAAESNQPGLPTESFRQVDSLVTQIISLSKIDSNTKSTEMSLVAVKEVADQITVALSDLSKEQKAVVDESLTASESAYSNASRLIFAAIAGALVIGAVTVVLVTRSLVVPISRVKEMANLMAHGDLTTRIGLKQSDEVGMLAEATDSLASSLSDIVSNVKNASSNLTTSAAQLTGVASALQQQSQRTTELSSGVASASEQLSTNISTISSSAEEMSMNFASIASATEEMSASINAISSTAEETSSNVSTIATAMQQISDSFGTVMTDVHNGAKVASQASQMATSATTTMQQLDQSSVEISKVTETIKMIALQTNLLALNATIEATSAGEAGKGFAVVAHEIKQLANQSGKAAEDIATKIESVQKGTQQAVEVIQQIARIIQDINASAERITTSVDHQSRSAQTIGMNISEASTGVGRIAQSIAGVAQTANEMSRNIGEATRGASDVSRNVGEAAKGANSISGSIVDVNRGALLSNESASEVAKASQVLCKLSEDLAKIAAKFKLSNV